MLKNLIVLPDGREISSGNQGPAILQLTLTRSVNSGKELMLGSACAAMLECTMFLPPEVPLEQGDALSLYQVDEQGNRHPVGVFLTQKPEHLGTHRRRLIAYDRMTLFDVDITQWVTELTDWPYSLDQLTAMLCAHCGVELATPSLPNGAFAVQAFSVRDCTARQLLGWIAEAAGRFCRIDSTGRLEFAWYTPTEIILHPNQRSGIQTSWLEDALTLNAQASWEEEALLLAAEGVTATENAGCVQLQCEGGLSYYQGNLALSDYAVEPITRVQIQQNSDDVGTVWPEEPGRANTYRITANPLLAALTPQTLKAMAATLYEQLRTVSYTPCKVSLPANLQVSPGQILTVSDRGGRQATVYVMREVRKGQRSELECTSSANRDSTTAVNNRSYQSLAGKVLNLRTDVDGLKVENQNTEGKLAALNLDLDGIRTQVEKTEQTQKQLSTQLQQTADSVSVFINRIETEGTEQVKTRNGYTFSEKGLLIRQSGESVQSRLSHEGLEVTRYGQTLLRADHEGVKAVDVTVGNYLILGTHCRLEDYPGSRTACYFI